MPQRTEPTVGKHTLAQFIRTKCLRQLGLSLYPDTRDYQHVRSQLGMPHAQSPRPGLPQIQQVGQEWQEEKLHDLTATFGQGAITGNPYVLANGQTRYKPIALASALSLSLADNFIVESVFSVGNTFKTALAIQTLTSKYGLQYGELRPDIVEVLPSGSSQLMVSADGQLMPIPVGDARLQLRVIDIKLTAAPSPAYFAEVALYSMALAGWLVDNGYDSSFLVVPEAALWPGSHDASALVKAMQDAKAQGVALLPDQLRAAMREDLELCPFEVFAIRIRAFFQTDLAAVLAQPWHSLDFHVDNRCSFCEYLGEPRPPNPNDPRVAAHPLHCLPIAQTTDHLSRVAFVSQGARLSLGQVGVMQVNHLAQRQPLDPVFDTHQTLRATRTVVAGRAAALQTGSVAIPANSGTSAAMPRWSDLRIYVSVDFDIGSAISVAFGLKAIWVEPRAFNSPLTTPRQSKVWQASARIVIDRNLKAEQHELLAFLKEIHSIIEWCKQQDARNLALPVLSGLSPRQRADYRTGFQLYIWDSLQLDHLTRIVGRHLQAILANQTLSYLVWLFPPEEVLENPESITRRSPITIVREVVRSLLAAPIPHYYTLLEVARIYHETTLPPAVATFSIHPLFGTSLSDQIPSERAHEIWARLTVPRHWQQQMQTYAETVRKRLSALETVTRRLESDLGNRLAQSSPPVAIGPPQRLPNVSLDGQLWSGFARLNAALDDLDVQQVRAMPPHERAARFRSARLLRKVKGQAVVAALGALGLSSTVGRYVYELAPDSCDIKAKVDDFSFALSPESMAGFLDRKVAGVVRGTPIEPRAQQFFGKYYWIALMEELTSVSIAGIDRSRALIALDTNPRWPTVLDDLQSAALANFDRDLILDPVHADFFTRKLDTTLVAIGNPSVAATNPLVQRAVGQTGARSRRTRRVASAVTEFLWDAKVMAATPVPRILAHVGPALQGHGLLLDQSQIVAWTDALTHRGRLIWGPPGTGKSRTVRAVAVAAILEALSSGKGQRVLISATTYNAIDNVLDDVARDLNVLAPGTCQVFRLRSKFQSAPTNASAIDAELNRAAPSALIRALRSQLSQASSVVVVGATPEQVHNLLITDNGAAVAEFFDLVLIDEASQMDIAHAVLSTSALTAQGAVVLAGDPLQLAPIRQAESPVDLEYLVGSVYEFWRRIHGVPESPLEVNYRSNDCIVSLAHISGYQPSLKSYSPSLRLNFLTPVPSSKPASWPTDLFWSADWAELLDPDKPAVCFVYGDGRSSQRNDFEASAVAALIQLTQGRLADQLDNERAPVTGSMIPSSNAPYAPVPFWSRGVGIVTPHRAQQGLIASKLIQMFGSSGTVSSAIRDAVDTVERFQGQQRDIIIASYTLGDPDQIGEEDEFLMSLNRFNVIASRARAKLIVLVSQEVINHLAHDIDVLRESRLLKSFAEQFCRNNRPSNLGYVDNGATKQVAGSLRWR